MSEDLREKIDEIRGVLKNWAGGKSITEKTRKSFLAKIAETAEYLGASLTVEHLLPGLQDIV
jgi:hypothetical protein